MRSMSGEPRLTYVLIGICVLAFLGALVGFALSRVPLEEDTLDRLAHRPSGGRLVVYTWNLQQGLVDLALYVLPDVRPDHLTVRVVAQRRLDLPPRARGGRGGPARHGYRSHWPLARHRQRRS